MELGRSSVFTGTAQTETPFTANYALPAGNSRVLLVPFITTTATGTGASGDPDDFVATYGGLPCEIVGIERPENYTAGIAICFVTQEPASDVFSLSIDDSEASNVLVAAQAFAFSNLRELVDSAVKTVNASGVDVEVTVPNAGDLLFTFCGRSGTQFGGVDLDMENADRFELEDPQGLGDFIIAAGNGRGGRSAWSQTVSGEQTVAWAGATTGGHNLIALVFAACDPSYNCECVEDPAARTLADMRAELTTRLGFVALKEVQAGKTLAELRLYMMRRLGYATQASSPPPGMEALIDEFLNEAQDIVWRRYAYDVYNGEPPPRMEAPEDECTADFMALQLLALANAKAHYGQPDAKQLLEQYETYLAELLQRHPLNLEATLNSILRDAQEQLHRRFETFKTERFFTWPLEPGVRYYGVRENNDCCADARLDAYKITWVGVEDVNGVWYELQHGIPPEFYTMTQQWEGWPARYEVRECIEIFPAPNADMRKLRIKGHFGLRPFSADEHKTTVDSSALFLWALGMAKRHYGQRDADTYFQQANDLIGRLVAGSHQTRRYVPRSRPARPLTPPKFLPLSEE